MVARSRRLEQPLRGRSSGCRLRSRQPVAVADRRRARGHGEFSSARHAGWQEALDFEGSRYVGLVGDILDDLPIAHAIPCWDVCQHPWTADPGSPLLGYAEHGGPWKFLDADGRVPYHYWVIDPTPRRWSSLESPAQIRPIEANPRFDGS